MKKIKEAVPLVLLSAVYVVLSFRYFPGNIARTLLETLTEIITVAPIPGGVTLLLVSFLQRTSGAKLPWDRSLRIYLTVGIMVEFLFGLHDFLAKG